MQRTAKAEIHDAVIIGSGAGGGPLALTLAQHGLNVVVLEKGRRYSRSDYVHDEFLLHNALSMFVPRLTEDPHILQRENNAAEITTLGWIASCVGGGTSHMGGSLLRLHPSDFRMASRFGNTYALADWPYAYEDLEPYYTMAEWAVGVSGTAGSNIFEGARSSPYPMPALDEHPLAKDIDAVAGGLGLHPFPTPRAINSVPYQGRPACSYCPSCAGYGCPTGARGSTQDTVLAAAERTGHCEVRPRSMVRKISVRADGRADGCVYIDEDGEEHRLRARIVCVCCSAVESARLLLLSKSSRFPDGLANGSGLVGKNLQFQCFSAVNGVFDGPRGRPGSNGNLFVGRSIMDYYHLPPGVCEIPKGGLLRFDMARIGPVGRAQRMARTDAGGLLWGSALKKALHQCCHDRHELEIEIFHDFIPNDQTFVDLDPDVRDKWGLPAARIHVSEPQLQHQAARWLLDRACEVLNAMGAQALTGISAGALNGNLLHGTCRSGKDARTSVLNEFCQAHEVPNLFVVDGSFMPTSGGLPSTLTILANSFRVGDFIVNQARTGVTHSVRI